MNNGVLASGYAPPQMPGGLLGSPAPLEMIDAYGYDADALRYIRAVEAADGQRLPLGVRVAVNEFVLGCKADGVWDALKACCILMGARTLTGALTPLVGSAPTNYNFVSGDYARKTGLKGNASTKYLDSGRNNSADGQNDQHLSVYVSAAASIQCTYLGSGVGGATGSSVIGQTSYMTMRSRTSASYLSAVASGATGFFGKTRSASASFASRVSGTDETFSYSSQTPYNGNVWAFRANGSSVLADCRLAFYSIGTALTLATLDTRVSALYTAIGAAI